MQFMSNFPVGDAQKTKDASKVKSKRRLVKASQPTLSEGILMQHYFNLFTSERVCSF